MSDSIKKARKPKTRRGRPKAAIDLRQLGKLCELQCTHEDLAAYFQVSVRTIERLAATPQVAEIIERGKNIGRLTVRRQQFKLLQKGNVTIAIWLGKQLLGQKEKVDSTLRTPPGDPLKIEADVQDRNTALLLTELFSPDEIAAAHRKMQERELHGQTTKVH